MEPTHSAAATKKIIAASEVSIESVMATHTMAAEAETNPIHNRTDNHHTAWVAFQMVGQNVIP
ncbi:MAG: hypothetical protein O2800_03330 [Planctomycetota bacterium]|nr:hypothetical protein [Planctomycetota bacterium]